MKPTFRDLMAGLRLLSFCALLPLASLAQEVPFTILPDDPVLARLDDLSQVHWLKNDPFTADTARLNVHGFARAEVPAWDAATYRHRLAVLDEKTPFALTYNQPVQAYIDLYAVKKREQTSRMLGLAQLYFPLFEEYLDRYNMPLELKYLAVVESALNPAARSRAAAVGLWQFILPTGRLYGLKIDSYLDERCDVHKSTEAACQYLTYLHGLYNNWELALAAYNCGPGNVNRAIRRAGWSGGLLEGLQLSAPRNPWLCPGLHRCQLHLRPRRRPQPLSGRTDLLCL
jgi:membrane-bound lytic murein transglycosylase D